MTENDIKEVLETYRELCKGKKSCKDCPLFKSLCLYYDLFPARLWDEKIDKFATVLKNFYDNKEEEQDNDKERNL